MKIGNKIIEDGKPAFIIAETACAHNGSLKQAKKLVEVAVKGEADIVQFIVFSTSDSVAPAHRHYKRIKNLEFSDDEWKELINYAKSKNILCSVAVEDMRSAKLMEGLNPDIFKIHSCDLSNPELIRYAASLKKPLIITVGASTFEEIGEAINNIKAQGNNDIVLMYGYQNYPTKMEGVNLKIIKTLKEKFKLPVGYADHTAGGSELAAVLPLLALPFGANLLDKHITLDRSKKGVDYESALNPDEFKHFVKNVRIIEKSFGDGIRHEFSADELDYRRISKKSILAAFNLKKGEKITRNKITFLRTNKPGLSPAEASKILGRKLIKNIKKFDNITLDNVK